MKRGDTFNQMLQTACKRARKDGRGESSRGNRKCVVDGRYDPIWTFLGIVHRIHGTVTCYYFDSAVFAIDFINERVTDFGMRGYSMTTGPNINGWESAVDKLLTLTGGKWRWNYSRWTFSNKPRKDYYWKPAEPTPETDFERFCKRLPWIYIDKSGQRWFLWKKYDETLAQQYDDGWTFLHNDQNWRYFEYDWDSKKGYNWVRKFKDKDAERRWNLREQSRMRKAA